MFTHAPKVHTFAAWVQPGGAVIRRQCAGGICRFRGNSSNRNHSATSSLSVRTWVFLQTRISVPVFSLFRQWSQRGHARTPCFAFSDNFAVPEDWERWCGLLSPEFAGMVHGNVSRPAAARKQLQTSLASPTLSMFTIWGIQTKNTEGMSNPKGGGMASKERLYELWMLYYTKVSGRPDSDTCCCSWSHWLNFPMPAGKHTVVFCVVCFKSSAEEEDGFWAFAFAAAYLEGFAVYLEKRVMTHYSLHEQFKFTTVINSNLTGAH